LSRGEIHPEFLCVTCGTGHELFDKLAEDLESPIDDIAERVTALGGVARGTARIAAQESRLPEFPLDRVEGLTAVALLADRYAALGTSTRAAIESAAREGDADTSDLFTAFRADSTRRCGSWKRISPRRSHGRQVTPERQNALCLSPIGRRCQLLALPALWTGTGQAERMRVGG